MRTELRTVVGCYGAYGFSIREPQPDHHFSQRLGMLAFGQPLHEYHVGASLGKCQDGPLAVSSCAYSMRRVLRFGRHGYDDISARGIYSCHGFSYPPISVRATSNPPSADPGLPKRLRDLLHGWLWYASGDPLPLREPYPTDSCPYLLNYA